VFLQEKEMVAAEPDRLDRRADQKLSVSSRVLAKAVAERAVDLAVVLVHLGA
jgi:hypothetical protein